MPDWKRLQELEIEQPAQYGQSLQVKPIPGNADTASAVKDVIRWRGHKTDVMAWRVYLGPWQPLPSLVAAFADTYADPTPWAPPEPRVYDAFASLPCYAQVNFGSGGIQHTAYVDWPERGLLFQVSGDYLQINAFVDSSGLSDPKLFPLLRASMGPEPGGGDSSQPGTFTYRRQASQSLAGPPQSQIQNFQIPPFARAFTPLLALRNILAQASFTQIRIATQHQPAPIIAGGTNNQQIWHFDPLLAADQTVLGLDFPLEPFPIAGQLAGTVRIEIDVAPEVGAPSYSAIGCMFALDL